jgi:universal stress protein E
MARVWLFHAINEPDALDALRRGSAAGHPMSAIMTSLTERSQKRLERLAALDDFRGLAVTCSATWDFPPHEAVIRRALAAKSDLVIAAAQPHALGGRLLLANTDWELIRNCPCPVLLVKSTRAYRKPAVIAAIDPFHAHAKPAGLDRRILEAGDVFARKLGARCTRSMHTCRSRSSRRRRGNRSQWRCLLKRRKRMGPGRPRLRRNRQQGRHSAAPPPPAHGHSGGRAGQRHQEHRRGRGGGRHLALGLRGLFIGSTAETILDKVDTDLLIIKPRDFKTRVANARRRLAQGMSGDFTLGWQRSPHGSTSMADV